MRRHVLVWASAVILLVATVWIVVAPWALLRYPTNLDQTLRYTGTVSQPVTPGASSEVRQPLSIVRHLRVVRSNFDKVWLRETVTSTIGSDVRVQENGYVLDRRTMKPVAGAGNFAFTTDNRVTRSGFAQVQLPMGIESSGAYKVWSDDTGATYNALGSGNTEKSGDLEVTMLTGHAAPHGVTDAYRAFLGLPESTTLNELATVAHVDIAAATAALATALPPTAMAQVSQLLDAPIPLEYQLESQGTVGVEPMTGGIVKTRNIGNRLTVSPDLASLHLRTVLADYALDPTVRTVLDRLEELSSRPPVPAMSLNYSVTPASERAAAHAAAELRNQARLVTMWVPGWATVFAVLLIGAAIMSPRRQPEAASVAVPPAKHHWRHRAA